MLLLNEWHFPFPPGFPLGALSRIRETRPRPQAFRLTRDERFDEKRCAHRPVYDLAFRDSGRFFYFEVIFGRRAGPSGTLATLLKVVNSLKVQPGAFYQGA